MLGELKATVAVAVLKPLAFVAVRINCVVPDTDTVVVDALATAPIPEMETSVALPTAQVNVTVPGLDRLVGLILKVEMTGSIPEDEDEFDDDDAEEEVEDLELLELDEMLEEDSDDDIEDRELLEFVEATDDDVDDIELLDEEALDTTPEEDCDELCIDDTELLVLLKLELLLALEAENDEADEPPNPFWPVAATCLPLLQAATQPITTRA